MQRTYTSLSQDIERKHQSVKESANDSQRKRDWLRHLSSVVESVYPGRMKLVLVGSSVTGFAAKGSDCDMCLLKKSFSGYESKIEVLRNIERKAKAESYRLQTELVSGAVVPIVILQDRSRDLEGDISYENTNTVFNTFLMRCYGELDSRVKPLVIVIKAWAQSARITNARDHKLSGFALVLLVIHYLQVGCSPPVLPSLQQDPQFHGFFSESSALKVAEHLENEYTPPPVSLYSSRSSASIGELLVGFFRYYSSFNWARVLSVRTAGFLPLPYNKKWRNPEIRIEDPTDRTNVARSVYRLYAFQEIKGAIGRAYNRLDRIGAELNDIM